MHVAGVKAVVEVAVKCGQLLMVSNRACRGRVKLPSRAEAVNLFEPCHQASYLVRQYWQLSIAPQSSLRAESMESSHVVEW